MYSKIDAYIEKLLNCSTPDAPIWNIESIRQGKAPHWNYIDGCMITSLLEIGRITEDKKYFDFAEQLYLNKYVK
jgi:unsaturated rhamnogalacturonyl hydrolase